MSRPLPIEVEAVLARQRLVSRNKVGKVDATIYSNDISTLRNYIDTLRDDIFALENGKAVRPLKEG